jgi:hypothetical protein
MSYGPPKFPRPIRGRVSEIRLSVWDKLIASTPVSQLLPANLRELMFSRGT